MEQEVRSHSRRAKAQPVEPAPIITTSKGIMVAASSPSFPAVCAGQQMQANKCRPTNAGQADEGVPLVRWVVESDAADAADANDVVGWSA